MNLSTFGPSEKHLAAHWATTKAKAKPRPRNRPTIMQDKKQQSQTETRNLGNITAGGMCGAPEL